MTDKQLFKYFKDRQHSFEEVPGDELWSKIETRISAGIGSKSLIIPILLAAATCTVVLTVLLFNRNKTTVIDEETVPAKEQLRELEIEEIAPAVIEKNADTVKKKKVAKKENQENGIKSVEDGIIPPSTVVTKDIASDEKQEQPLKETLPGNNIITTTPGKIRIQSRDQLTKAQYDTLVARAVKYYSDQPKSLLTIVAKGYKPYRKLVEVALREQNKLQGKDFAPINGFIRFMDTPGDTIKIKEPDLAPTTIKFKEKKVEKNVFFIEKVEPAQDTITDDFDY